MSQDIFNGVIPSPYSPYDYSCRVMAAKEHAAEYIIDTRGKAYDQKVGNCVAQTARAFARIVTGREYGVDMMYGGARTDGRETSGLYTREAADFFIKNGIALIVDDPNETDVPEVIAYWDKNKSKLCNSAELSGGIWYRVETIDEIKCALETGMPVWCAVAWYGYQPQYEGKGLLRYEPDKRPSGYHEMLIVGWKQCEDGERAIFLNSHGEDAGDEGYCYGKWEHVLALNDCIVMNVPSQSEPEPDTPIVAQRTLRLKTTMMTGDDVNEMQELLNKHGVQCVVNGVFDEATDKAVRAFQKLKGLDVDGICGAKTWAALREEPTTPPPYPNPEPEHERRDLYLQPKPRMEGKDVKEVQSLLNKHGIACSVDGIFGPATDEAVRKFQTATGILVTGVVDAATWEALLKDPSEPSVDYMSIATDMTYWLRMMVGWHYIIGAQGHKLTESYLSSRYIGHESYFKGGRLEWLRGEISRAESMGINLYCADCSGLFFKVNEMMGILPIKDATAHGLWTGYCVEISKRDVRPGDILFRESGGKMVHMAVVGTDGVYESAGTEYGVVYRKWGNRFTRVTHNRMTGKTDTLSNWTHYGRLKVLV